MELIQPADPCGTGVLVLAGSSGRVDRERAALLSRHGALAAPLQWFGGRGMQAGPWEVPIESFMRALDVLAPEVDRVAVVGSSFGAEAALVTGTLDDRIDHVAAFAPSSFVWAAYDEDKRRATSKWTYNSERLPCLPIVRPSVKQTQGPPRYLTTYEHSLSVADPDDLQRARIAVERIRHILLVTGGDDQVWPSTTFAEEIMSRRTQNGLETQHVYLEEAGHRAVLPGESPPKGGRTMLRGGTPAADFELGRRAWPALCELLNLGECVEPG